MSNHLSAGAMLGAGLTPDVCQRAVRARDPRFDGVFFVAITTTRVYCRPVCPARVTHPDRRRFFPSAAAAEHAGFRPCLRCRPELAPGRALCDAVSRLAGAAAHRIAAGALNGRSVAELARELCVSERHLRRALERELGVSAVALAQTHRLLLAKRLLADTDLSITRIAYASGFQSLRRFNTVFRERYRMPPNAMRRTRRSARGTSDGGRDFLRLTLAYRGPLAWDDLIARLGGDALPGVEQLEARRFARTVRLNGATGAVIVEHPVRPDTRDTGADATDRRNAHLNVSISGSLVPALMPLLAKLRQLFDLDAEPSVIDGHLEQGGLAQLVRGLPGMRIPGAVEGFDVAWRALVATRGTAPAARRALLRRIVEFVAEPVDTGVSGLNRVAPCADRFADAGTDRLVRLGLAHAPARAIVYLAGLVADGRLPLEPGADVDATHRALLAIDGVSDRIAATIIMRALHWPDAFPASDRTLQHAAGASGERALLDHAERWRPWRAYAALHLCRASREGAPGAFQRASSAARTDVLRTAS